FERVHKIESGTAIVIDATGRTITRYWVPEDVPLTDLAADAAESTLETLLVQAVNKQVRADVPVGVFTSGGVDSALLAVLARDAVGARDLHTFTVGFEDASYDERAHAARLAQYVDSEHVEIALGEEGMQGAFDVVSERLAEPVADPAILPTYLLARVARQHVGVVLSGEGADELFGGYPTYLGHRHAPGFARLPAALRTALQVAADLLPPSESKVPLGFLLKRFVAHADRDLLTRHVAWFGTGLPDHLVPPEHEEAAAQQRTTDGDPLRRVMLFDYLTYLPDNLLAKVDRATMLNSLEARSPFLDRDVVRFALGMNTDLKIRGTTTKWLLKRVAAHRLPRGIVHRRKGGLSVPVGRWLNEGLRAESDRLLAPERVREVGVLNAEPVRQLLFEHRSRRADHTRALWALLVLERWRERWIQH
ncbi:MAG: asparagine synthase C-terminal domain-containing protein, partial [Gemmatimonadota bacterium]|nr:asparagine synthase C-terminal domain-containing protein [Gemmatimonadota bacterium]